MLIKFEKSTYAVVKHVKLNGGLRITRLYSKTSRKKSLFHGCTFFLIRNALRRTRVDKFLGMACVNLQVQFGCTLAREYRI